MLKIMFLLAGIFYFGLTIQNVHGSLQCMVCNDSEDIRQCLTNTVTCSTGEKCFLEVITRSSDGKTVYNGGCRSDQVCKAAALLGKRKRSLPQKRDKLKCTECCNTAPDIIGPCNAKLCAANPVRQIPVCLSCTLMAGPDACLTRTACQDTQVCGNEIMIVGGTFIRFNYYCEERHLCATAYQHRGKRSLQLGHAGGTVGLVLCNSCCIGDECNSADCFALQKNFTSTDFLPVTTQSSG